MDETKRRKGWRGLFAKADRRGQSRKSPDSETRKTTAGRPEMALSSEEKAIVQEALQVYVQIAARQMPQAHVQQIAQVAEGIVRKIETLGSGSGAKGNKPAGITDEWYQQVCLGCDKLSASGCTDKVTAKFPGKCDPIIHYENRKAGLGKQEG
jgi:hypothetical protein